jgi:hypothetical protein
MSFVQTVSITVTHVDVLHVAQQIKRDLQALRHAYPALIDADRVLDLHDAIVTFLSNDAINSLGFSVFDPRKDNLVLHELRYNINYNGSGPRIGLGGATVSPVRISRTAQMRAWVAWSSTMRALTTDRQRQILQGTGWGFPGTSAFRGRYSSGSWTPRTIYSSGMLAAEAQEYRSN